MCRRYVRSISTYHPLWVKVYIYFHVLPSTDTQDDPPSAIALSSAKRRSSLSVLPCICVSLTAAALLGTYSLLDTMSQSAFLCWLQSIEKVCLKQTFSRICGKIEKGEETPHFSTVSYNFRHRFTAETVDQIFAWILNEIAEAEYLSPKAVFIDGTHIKANANTKKGSKGTDTASIQALCAGTDGRSECRPGSTR